jgi:hypothetical protein
VALSGLCRMKGVVPEAPQHSIHTRMLAADERREFCRNQSISRKESCAKFFRKCVNERTPDCKMQKPRTGGERGF